MGLISFDRNRERLAALEAACAVEPAEVAPVPTPEPTPEPEPEIKVEIQPDEPKKPPGRQRKHHTPF